MKFLPVLFGIFFISESKNVYRNLYGSVPFNDEGYNMLFSGTSGAGFILENMLFTSAEPVDQTPNNNDKFDFIVVGAGTAGATIASRLSEIPDVRVLLIEAGSSEDLYMDVPLLVQYLQYMYNVNWGYQTEPSNDFCRGMKNKQCNWPRGKVMGGSSVLNYMIATRGHSKDYDRWAELGNEGWGWEDVLPFFKKLESFQVPEHKDKKVAHNDDGPVHLNYTQFQTPLAQAFIKAGMELGYKQNNDYNNGDDLVGFSYLHTNIKKGLRVSSSRAYLHPAKSRSNLIVTKKSLVKKILFDEENKRAIGVEYEKGSQNYRVYAEKEVILSAGAIGSPQILMLSGIGPAEHLKKKGISSIVNLPVGENLQDHIAYGGLVFSVNQPVGINLLDMLNPANPYQKDFYSHRSGPLTIPGGCEALAFLDVYNPENQNAYPNMELLFVSSSFVTVDDVRKNMGISTDVSDKYNSLNSSYTWTVYPMLLRPKSRGRILLRDNDIHTHPVIMPNYMADKDDVKILIKGIKATLKVARTKAMREFGSRLFNTNFTDCPAFDEDSDDFWECATRTITMNLYHYSGTCKMGPKSDPTAVVDARLRVHGIKGLRVADGSIMPEIISGHTNIPIFMIGEKLSDMVKEDWGY